MNIKFEDKCNLCNLKFEDQREGYFATAFRKDNILIGLFELRGVPDDWNRAAEEIRSLGFVEVPICSGCLKLNY
jgi:hypothetical protein